MALLSVRHSGDEVLQLSQPGGSVEVEVGPGRDLPIRCSGGQGDYFLSAAQAGGTVLGELSSELLEAPVQLLADSRYPQLGKLYRVRGRFGQRVASRLLGQ
ncbi:hypothetical protein OG217_37100 (plasmid) [Streptomyces sp. NBC_01023]|uniref:hypothetical protein n=1 Tax=unclassified Streptomyces TaxID=2593676 RepID=UPI002F914951|nr:hypothetical protein OG217_37100 [Streptomyces sp. NBC_01023]